jgi:hypothetical protein
MTILLAVWMDRSSRSYPVTLTLMLLSVYSTFRYGFWRVSTVLAYLPRSGHALDRAGCVLHLAAAAGGVLCVCGATAGLSADAVAAAAHAGAAARRS